MIDKEFDGSFLEPLPQIPASEDYDLLIGLVNDWANEIYENSSPEMQMALFFCFRLIARLRNYELSEVDGLSHDADAKR